MGITGRPGSGQNEGQLVPALRPGAGVWAQDRSCSRTCRRGRDPWRVRRLLEHGVTEFAARSECANDTLPAEISEPIF